MKFSMRMKKSFALRSVFATLAFGLLFLGTSKITNGQTTTFAQFTLNPAGQSFVFTNNGSNATFETTPTTGVPINFNYSNIANLNAALTGTQSAKLFVDRTTTTASTTQVGVLL